MAPSWLKKRWLPRYYIPISFLKKPDLHVICATRESNQLGERLEAYRALAVLEGLLPGLDNPQRKRIAFFKRKEMIHAKTVLIDDRWALGGSSNIARRSLYLDIEHAQR